MTINEANYEDVLKIRQQVMYPDKDIDFVKLPNDEMGIHIGAFENGILVAAVTIFMQENRNLQFRKLATQQNMQRKGYATALLKWINDYASDVKLNRIWCNARAEAIGLYIKSGYTETAEKFDRDGYTYVVMEKILA